MQIALLYLSGISTTIVKNMFGSMSILRAPFHYCEKMCSQNLPIYIRRSSEALGLKVCEEYCSNYCHLPSAHRGDSEAVVVMATNPEKIKQEALASLEQLTEMAEARLKDQKITEWQVGTRPLSVPFLFRTSQSSWLDYGNSANINLTFQHIS